MVFEGVYCNTLRWLNDIIWDLKQKCLHHTAIYQSLQYRQYSVGQWITRVLFEVFSTQCSSFHTVTCLCSKEGIYTPSLEHKHVTVWKEEHWVENAFFGAQTCHRMEGRTLGRKCLLWSTNMSPYGRKNIGSKPPSLEHKHVTVWKEEQWVEKTSNKTRV